MRPLEGVRLGIGAWLAFITIRRLERFLSATALRRVLAPFVFIRVAFKRNHPSVPLPSCLWRHSETGLGTSLNGGNFSEAAGASAPRSRAEERGEAVLPQQGHANHFQITKLRQREDRLNAALEFFPERLAAAKWRGRLRIDGLEYLETARRQKRPVVLAFCHFGPYVLLRYWLRALGYPAAMLVRGRSEARSALKRLKDSHSPFAEVPTAFYHENQLREMIEFVSAGHPLLMALDVAIGKNVEVPVDAGWQFRMASGAIRLAMRNRAALIPCSIIDLGGWHFEITLGPPVPGDIMQSGDELRAGRHLIETMLPVMRAHPHQFSGGTLGLFQPAVPERRFAHEIHSGEFVAG